MTFFAHRSRRGVVLLALMLCGIAAASAQSDLVIETVRTIGGTDRFAPGSLAVIRGRHLSATHETAPDGRLPLSLGGVSVTVEGRPAAVQSVTPSQVVIQIPYELPVSKQEVSSFSLLLHSPLGTVASTSYILLGQAPALLTSNGEITGQPEIRDDHGQRVQTVQRGQRLHFFAAGLGQTTPAALTGELGGQSGVESVAAGSVHLLLGGARFDVEKAILSPDQPGIYEIIGRFAATPSHDCVVLTNDEGIGAEYTLRLVDDETRLANVSLAGTVDLPTEHKVRSDPTW